MKKIAFVFLAMALLALVACTKPAPVVEPDPITVEPADNSSEFLNTHLYTIHISDFAFTPKQITIYQGDRVKWTNDMPFVKSVWIWAMAPGPVISPGKSWSYIFNDVGFFKYRDQFAQDMEGNVTVLPYSERPDVKSQTQS